jgi:hypothetical protein
MSDKLTKRQQPTALMEVAADVSNRLPEHLQKYVGDRTGYEDLGKDDIATPRLCVAQSNSPQVVRGNDKRIEGLVAGEFFNSATNERLGESVTVVPLFFFRNFIKFIPREDGGGIDAMYDSESQIPPTETWRLDQVVEGKPTVTEFKNWACALVTPNGLQPIIVSFKSTGMKICKQWAAAMRQLNAPPYVRSYTISLVTRTNNDGTWFVHDIKPASFLPEKLVEQCVEFEKGLRETGVKIDTTSLDDEDVKPNVDF